MKSDILSHHLTDIIHYYTVMQTCFFLKVQNNIVKNRKNYALEIALDCKKAKHPTKKAWLSKNDFFNCFFIHSIFSQAEISSKNNSSTTGVGEHALYLCNKSSALILCSLWCTFIDITNVWFPIPLITTTKKIKNEKEAPPPPPKKKSPTCGKQDFIDFIKMNDVHFKMRQKMTTNKLHLCSLTKQLY